ncbi:MAG TPA: hypothetical protein VK784_16755 [Pseudonocardiaceae bacterium]|jgi:hypothetical protein|nr:hypothetical protein [Pseudonocardiaceae bacterium]
MRDREPTIRSRELGEPLTTALQRRTEIENIRDANADRSASSFWPAPLPLESCWTRRRRRCATAPRPSSCAAYFLFAFLAFLLFFAMAPPSHQVNQ